MDENFEVLKNITDYLLFAETLEDMEIQKENLVRLCRRINLKLAPLKFGISTAVVTVQSQVPALSSKSWTGVIR